LALSLRKRKGRRHSKRGIGTAWSFLTIKFLNSSKLRKSLFKFPPTIFKITLIKSLIKPSIPVIQMINLAK
jgi:hypothetical protein